MSGNTGLKLLFVINDGAGANNITWKDIISNYFTGKPYSVDFFMLGKKPDVEALRKHLKETAPDKAIAVGGDGTVGLVANSIAGTKAALGILPAGSANGMARELNIPEKPEEALSIIENGEINSCDAIKINGQHMCIHLADLGLNAQMIRYFDQGKLRGKLGYAKVIFKTLWHSQKINFTIQTGENTIRTKAFMVVLANASKYGTGAVINPDGKLNDGKFELVIVRKLSLIEIIKTFFGPRPLDPEKIEVIKTDSVKIQTTRRTYFQVDGEYLGKTTALEAVIVPRYINIIQRKENT